jgi:hypothetical protein
MQCLRALPEATPFARASHLAPSSIHENTLFLAITEVHRITVPLTKINK